MQYIAAAALTAICAFTFETRVMIWSPQLIFALVWLTLAISIGAILALLVMIREGGNVEGRIAFLSGAGDGCDHGLSDFR